MIHRSKRSGRRFKRSSGTGGALLVGPVAYLFTLGNHRLEIDPSTSTTRLIATNGQDALRALDGGTAAGTEITWQPIIGEHFRLHLDGAPDDYRPLTPAPLGLPGYTDPQRPSPSGLGTLPVAVA